MKFNKKKAQKSINVLFTLQQEYDSYEEWLDDMYGDIIRDLRNGIKIKDENDTYYHNKKALEDIFQRRECVTVEELMRYVEGIMKPIKRSIIILLLMFYFDVFKDDENFKKDLYEDTKKTFSITEKEINNYRVVM